MHLSVSDTDRELGTDDLALAPYERAALTTQVSWPALRELQASRLPGEFVRHRIKTSQQASLAPLSPRRDSPSLHTGV
jgi:hypothetical protein